PLKGTPKNLDRSAKPISIRVRTEPLFSKLEHDVFFNRGVASSQAYARKFHNLRPDKLPPQKQAEALKWLSRDLDTALLKFIANEYAADRFCRAGGACGERLARNAHRLRVHADVE